MESLSQIKLTLLTQSKNLINLIKLEQWGEFPALNAQYQENLEAAFSEYGDGLNEILQALLEDNDTLQQLIKQQQIESSNDFENQLKNMQQVKAYLNESV